MRIAPPSQSNPNGLVPVKVCLTPLPTGFDSGFLGQLQSVG